MTQTNIPVEGPEHYNYMVRNEAFEDMDAAVSGPFEVGNAGGGWTIDNHPVEGTEGDFIEDQSGSMSRAAFVKGPFVLYEIDGVPTADLIIDGKVNASATESTYIDAMRLAIDCSTEDPDTSKVRAEAESLIEEALA